MQTIPARITDIKTADELDAMRTEAAIGVVADQFRTATDAYSTRTIAYEKRYEQDSTALFFALGGISQYLNDGGDPRVAVIIQSALNFATEH